MPDAGVLSQERLLPGHHMRAVRALVAIVKASVLESVAYRTEFFIWFLSANMPLVNMALWATVARDGPVGRYRQSDFIAYFLAVQTIRLLTGTTVQQRMDRDIHWDSLNMKLLRPVSPLLWYAAQQMGLLPMRAAMGLGFLAALRVAVGPGHLPHDPIEWAIALGAVMGAWALSFLTSALIGCGSFFVMSGAAMNDVWLALFSLLSGYVVPLDLFPTWSQKITGVLPFRLMIEFPADALLVRRSPSVLLPDLILQMVYVVLTGAAVAVMWRRGLRRYGDFGG